MRLTIAIPTVENRKEQFKLLRDHIQNQINEFGYRKEVQVISLCDNKEMSIGQKRQKLIEMAKGEYIVMIDDDDWVPYYFIANIMKGTEEAPDCIGYLEKCIYDDRIETSCFSIRYKEWGNKIDSFDHVRTPFFKTPIKTAICKLVKCRDMRFAEDHDFAKRIYPFLKTEYFINDIMYEYRYKHEPHSEKYGIR